MAGPRETEETTKPAIEYDESSAAAAYCSNTSRTVTLGSRTYVWPQRVVIIGYGVAKHGNRPPPAVMARDPVHSVKRPQLAAEAALDPSSSYVTVGAYNHGGQYGVTKYTSEAPQLTKKFTELLQLDFPNECFTSATLVKNAYMPTHKDVFNDKNSRNLVSPLKVTEGAGVWEELKPGDVFSGRYQELDVKGVPTPGQVHSLTTPVTVNPKRWHCAVQGSEGPRLLLVGHTIGSWRKLKPEMNSELEEAGFALPLDGDGDVVLKHIGEVNQQVQYYSIYSF